MRHGVEYGKLSDRCPIAPEFVGMNDFRDLILIQQPTEEGPGRVRVPMRLEQEVEHHAVLIHSAPQPMFDTLRRHAHFVEMPPGGDAGVPGGAVPQSGGVRT